MSQSTPNVKDIFDRASEIDAPVEREAFLAEACAGAPDVRREVEDLLQAYAQAGSFLDRPAIATVDLPTSHPGGPAHPGAEIGTIIAGRYKLLQAIGEGGMGTVFMAEQTQPLRRSVALKVVKAGMDSRQMLARFEAERQALALMDHPNIAKVLDAGSTESGHPFFVMEMVLGVPLTQFCDEKKLSVADRLQIFQQVCNAVQHAHQKGIIHRDLKPTNILVESHEGRPLPKVIDFGVAKAIRTLTLTDHSLFTTFGGAVGTPLYMAPEQAEIGAQDVDTRADIYSLGVILYELLTGTTPLEKKRFAAAAWDEIRRIIREEVPQTPSARLSTTDARASIAAQRQIEPGKLGKFVRGDLDWIVMKALSKERDRRYETANAFAADVGRFLADEPVSAGPPTIRYKLRKFIRRHRGPVVAGVVLVGLLILGTVGTSIGLARALRAERAAKSSADIATIAESVAKDETAVAKAVNEFLLEDLLAEAAPDKNPRNKKVTVEELLRRAADRIPTRFAGQPRVEAAIRQTIGETFLALGNYREARPHMERALSLRREVLGEEDPATLTSMSNLGLLDREQGRFKEGEQLQLQALQTSLRIREEENPETLVFMNNLAVLYHSQGQLDNAEPLYVKVLEVRKRILPKDHPHTLATMSNLGLVYQSQGQLEKAEELLTEALNGQLRIHSEEHADTFFAMNNLAILHFNRGRVEKATELMLQTLEGRKRVLGDDHPLTFATMLNLADMFRSAGKFDRAAELLLKAREIALRLEPEGSLHTFQLAHNLGVFYHAQSQYGKAKPFYIEAMIGRKRVLGADNSITLITVGNLGWVYLLEGEYEKARPLFTEMLECYRRLDPASAMTGYAAQSLGLNLLFQEKYADAEKALVECLKIREKTEPDSWTFFDAKALLGRALLGQKKYLAAEPLLKQGYEGLKLRADKIVAHGRTPLLTTADWLIELYTALGNTDDLAKLKTERAAYLPPTERGPMPRELKRPPGPGEK